MSLFQLCLIVPNFFRIGLVEIKYILEQLITLFLW